MSEGCFFLGNFCKKCKDYKACEIRSSIEGIPKPEEALNKLRYAVSEMKIGELRTFIIDEISKRKLVNSEIKFAFALYHYLEFMKDADYISHNDP